MNKINNYYSTSTIFVLRKWCVVWSIFFFLRGKGGDIDLGDHPDVA